MPCLSPTGFASIDDNVWMVDEGSNMIVKVDPNGLVAMTLGRKPEAIDCWRSTSSAAKKTLKVRVQAATGHV